MKRNGLLIFFLAAALFANKPAGTAAGAGTEGTSLTIEEAVSTALSRNHDYRMALQNVKAAKEKVSTAWGQLMPALESEASMLRQGAENGTMSLSDGQYDIKVVQLRFGINPGAFYNSLMFSRKSYIAAKEELKRVKSEIEYRVITSYFDYILALEVVAMRKESMELYRRNLQDVKNLYRTGSVPKFELLQAQVQYKSREPELLEAENNLRTSLDVFNYHLGYDSSRHRPDHSVLKKKFLVPDSDAEKTVPRLREVAMKNRPELVQVNMKREIAAHGRDLKASMYLWPTFTVAGYYGKTKLMPNPVDVSIPVGAQTINPDFSGITGTDEWQDTWQVRVAATYRWGSLFAADPAKSGEREQEARVREAEEELLRLKRLITISIRSSYSKLLTAYMTIQSQKDNVVTAEEGLRIAKESYRAGVIKNSDLISSEYSLTSARTSYIHAVHNYYAALAELKRETGVDNTTIILRGE
ncbi:MAG TPA: TolC family protein [Spirochaetota bacterium]|nr:TolC family protein [Spirochaetota bacterium]